LRVVDRLEERYAGFDGLNLTFETREGIIKHCSKSNAEQLGELGERFVHGWQPSLEAQIANIADAIAYNNHDVDDGLRAGLITVEQLREVELFAAEYDEVMRQHPGLAGRRLIHEIIRRMINRQVVDLLQNSESLLKSVAPQNIDEVRKHGSALITFSEPMERAHRALKQFLREQLYRHYRVHRMSTKAQSMVYELYEAFFGDPRLLPHDYQQRAAALEHELGISGRARAVADYIAGMTDRFAIVEHQKLFSPSELT
jgi:dGTPase